MRFLMGCAFAVLLANFSMAQQPPQPSPDPQFEAKIRQEMMSLDQQEARLKLEERKLDIARREHGIEMQRKMMDEKFAGRTDDRETGRSAFWKRLPVPLRLLPVLIAAKVLFGMMFLCAMCCGLLHILLTMLVFSDMQKRGSVNGLWVPVVLIGGLFAAMVYALMRNNSAKVG
jgi:hypothetical protein